MSLKLILPPECRTLRLSPSGDINAKENAMIHLGAVSKETKGAMTNKEIEDLVTLSRFPV